MSESVRYNRELVMALLLVDGVLDEAGLGIVDRVLLKHDIEMVRRPVDPRAIEEGERRWGVDSVDRKDGRK